MILDQFDEQGLSQAGFTGFLTIAELSSDRARIPAVRGVYAVLRTVTSEPEFTQIGSGGHFKGKDPNVEIADLQRNWVPGAQVVYIGKAGDPGRAATLRSRLWQYLRFGEGANVGHWGGRYIWQLADRDSLIIAWNEMPDGVPSELESELIGRFRGHFGERPFANLAK
ncbi:hypothetical protein [Leucobacter salsicius]|uniref:hypothetical protein n=1 Tax=Leucobacter salsicius TaxID=664638 RepID=UPI00035D3706|nr:hypothetical protein [Leucobacter salsicius]